MSAEDGMLPSGGRMSSVVIYFRGGKKRSRKEGSARFLNELESVE